MAEACGCCMQRGHGKNQGRMSLPLFSCLATLLQATGPKPKISITVPASCLISNHLMYRLWAPPQKLNHQIYLGPQRSCIFNTFLDDSDGQPGLETTELDDCCDLPDMTIYESKSNLTKYFIMIINVAIQKAFIMQLPSHDSDLGIYYRSQGCSLRTQRLKLTMYSDPKDITMVS